MPDDDYARALVRLDGMPGLGDLYYLVRALLVERQAIADGPEDYRDDATVDAEELADAALRNFARGKDA